MSDVVSGNGWTLYHGDCLEVMQTLGEVDHCFADPPYSAQVHGGVRSAKRNSAPDVAEFACRTRRVVDLGFEHITEPQIRTVSQFLAALVRRWVGVFSDLESSHLWRAQLKSFGLDYVRTAVWDRVGGAPQFTGDRPAVACETITLAHPKGRKRWNGGGKRGMYSYPIVQNRGGRNPRWHTTEKPLGLCEEILSDFTNPAETVLDCFAGSGTTGVAALRLGRRFIGIERDEKYFRLACDRLRAEENGSTLAAARAGQVALFGGAK